MVAASDLWTGFARNGAAVTSMNETTGVLTFEVAETTGGRYRRSETCWANSKGTLTIEARMVSGTGRIFVEYGGAYRYCPCKALGELDKEWTVFELPVVTYSSPQFGALTFGLECRAGEIGRMEVRMFRLDMPGIAGGSAGPGTLASGSYRATLTSNGKLVVSDTGTSITDGAGERAIQAHGVSSGTAGFFTARWDDGSGGPVISTGKSRGGARGTHKAVQSGDDTGVWQAQASNGVGFSTAGQVGFKVGAAPAEGGPVPGFFYIDVTQDTGSQSRAISVDHLGNVKTASGRQLDPNAINGFQMIQKITGRPTGTPANVPTNCAAMVFNDFGPELSIYSARTGRWYHFQPIA